MSTDFGTYKNQYGKTVHDRGPSEGMTKLILTLLAEKVVPNDYVAGLVDRFNTDDLSGREAKNLIDQLIGAKSQIVAPSTLSQDGERSSASEKQLHWINKMLAEKNVPELEAARITTWVNEGFPGRNAGRVMDYLFDLPAANAVQTQGFLGEIGDKITVEGTITTFRSIDSKFGPTNLIVITTEDGKAVKAFSNAKGFWGLEEGSPVTVTGTVKSHDSFKGSEATVISRPSVG
jgi:hypothetical protein